MAVSSGSNSAALFLMALGNHLRTRGEYAEAQNYLEKGLALAEAQEDIFTQGRIMSLLARVYFEQGFYQQTQQSALEAERLLRLVDAPDRGWLLIALERQAMSHLRLGQAKQALAVGEAARQLAPLTNNKDALAQILNLLGSTNYFLLGEYKIADNYFEEAIMLHRENGNRSSEAIILLNQADNAMTTGNFQRAEAKVQEALKIIHETGDKIKELSIRVTQSEIQVHLGNYKTAVDILTSVFNEAPKDWTYAGIANIVLAQGFLGLGEVEEALKIVQSSALVQSDDPFDSGEAWRILGRVAAQLGQPVAAYSANDTQYSAADCFGRSLQVFTEIDNKRERAITLWHWAAYELETGDEILGKRMWEEAKAVFRGLNLPVFIARLENQ
jgi:tetratricopeptide (TPR) repeat protein